MDFSGFPTTPTWTRRTRRRPGRRPSRRGDLRSTGSSPSKGYFLWSTWTTWALLMDPAFHGVVGAHGRREQRLREPRRGATWPTSWKERVAVRIAKELSKRLLSLVSSSSLVTLFSALRWAWSRRPGRHGPTGRVQEAERLEKLQVRQGLDLDEPLHQRLHLRAGWQLHHRRRERRAAGVLPGVQPRPRRRPAHRRPAGVAAAHDLRPGPGPAHRLPAGRPHLRADAKFDKAANTGARCALWVPSFVLGLGLTYASGYG